MRHIDHTNTIIELVHVSFAYGSEPAIKDVSLKVHQGDYLGIIGPNGSGKSTLLKLTLGLLIPSHGHVLLYGTDINDFHDWSRIGYLSQQVTHIDPNFPMTVKEAVSMGRFPKIGLFHSLRDRDREKIRQALEHVEMWEYRNQVIGDLSGGQQQRVFIARVLAGEPEIIFLDEPTVGVDAKAQRQFYELLQKLNTDLGLTLILVSHDLNIVAKEATEIAYINRTLVYHGVPEKFMKSEYFEKLSGEGIHHHA